MHNHKVKLLVAFAFGALGTLVVSAWLSCHDVTRDGVQSQEARPSVQTQGFGTWSVSVQGDLGSGSDLPIYVVEEHHEVIPYWFGAVESGRIKNKLGNTLIHIDAHSDMAYPEVPKASQVLRWPTPAEWPQMMTENDRFLTSASFSGIFSHVVWVWPGWDWEMNETTHEFGHHVTFDAILGKVKGDTDGICSCIQFLDPPKTPTDSTIDLDYKHCYKYDTQSRYEPVPAVEMEVRKCEQKLKVRVDVLSEEKFVQAVTTNQFSEVSARGGFILDIDEDYFGCEASVMPLYSLALDEVFIRRVSFWVESTFCGRGNDAESIADGVFSVVVEFILSNRGLCDFEVKEENLTLSHPCVERVLAYVSSLMTNGASMNDILCDGTKKKYTAALFTRLVALLSTMSDQQLHTLAEIGVCWQASPNTHSNKGVGRFRLCDGENRPNNTAVIFYTPDEYDVRQRARRLEKALELMTSSPHIITVCRSMRDGYTPRSRFHQIEANVLELLDSVYRDKGRYPQVVYQNDLMGGPSGWPGRSHKFRYFR